MAPEKPVAYVGRRENLSMLAAGNFLLVDSVLLRAQNTKPLTVVSSPVFTRPYKIPMRPKLYGM
ncbi:hypothetical protein DD238_000139 [Peronospora effusa]|uniref:Uncharacterized protein n=1 Tax=Peronospora effusa TaxID=542832 RepID=A0A3M6VMN8_9STRA|nr:hypothetical protein DD238_000139 [Peronospora effusa]